MKKILLPIMLLLISSLFGFSQNGKIALKPDAKKSFISKDEFSGFSTTFVFQSVESKTFSNAKGTFSQINLGASVLTGNVGEPALPTITKIIAIPEGTTPVVSVSGYSEDVFTLADYGISKICPKQPSVRKNANLDTVKFIYNENAYSVDEFSNREIAKIEILGTIRGMKIARLVVHPVAYNPVAGTIKVLNNINVNVDFPNADYNLTKQSFENNYSPAFNSVYSQVYNRGVYDDNTDLYHTPVKMLVICSEEFENNETLASWLQWKAQKGIFVDIAYTSTIGTTSTAIKNYITSQYNTSVTSGNAYSYLVTIGDVDQIPAQSNNTIDELSNIPSDLYYASTNGDVYPEMFYGRISVETNEQLTNYLNKVLVYEKYTMADPSYLNNVVMVAGWDSYGNTTAVAKPTLQYGQTNYFNSSNLTYGGFEDGTLSVVISTSSTQGFSGSNNGAFNGINNGACLVNYSAHGDVQEWSQPQFNSSQVPSLTNSGKYFFAIGNCCLSGNFNNSSSGSSPGTAIGADACFGETMIRVPDKGAIGYIGCAPYSYWYEDFYWSVGAHNFSSGNYPSTSASTTGVFDAMFIDEYWNTMSSLVFLGNLSVSSAEESNYTYSVGSEYYWKYYHFFGDASVMPYFTEPEENTVSYDSPIVAATSMVVNAVPGSYVSVSLDGEILGVAVADALGEANVSFSSPLDNNTILLVVTRQQYQPFMEEIEIVAAEPPVADFTGTPTTLMVGETVQFTDASANVSSRLWSFGDGTTSTSKNPSKVYNAQGVYTVSLTVSNSLGTDTETKTDYITVNPNTNPPTADFVANVTEINQGGTVNFTDLSTNFPTSWSWSFSGGTPATSTEQNPSVVYSEAGTYPVSLYVTNDFGNDSEIKTGYITVLYPDIVMSNEDVTVCGGIYKDNGGDGNYASNSSYTQTIYPASAGSVIRLTFNSIDVEEQSWGGSGCYDELSIYDGESTSATKIGTYCGTDISDIGTNGVVTATNSAGALTINFESDYSENGSGWEAVISCYSEDALPIADFVATPTTVIYNSEINFTDLSTGADSWLWTFEGGNPATSTEQNPVVLYDSVGVYDVSLQVSNSNGTDTETKTDYILIVLTDGISENNLYFSIYPNPSHDILNLSASQIVESVKIYSLTGQIIDAFDVNDYKFSRSVANIANGVYSFAIYTANGVYFEKIIINNN